jgi:hypothetical protein
VLSSSQGSGGRIRVQTSHEQELSSSYNTLKVEPSLLKTDEDGVQLSVLNIDSV